MNSTYWDNYYKEHGLDKNIQQGSTFACFLQDKFLNYTKKSILEIGSGNGRDARYFANKGHDLVAIDQSHIGVEIGSNLKLKNIKFIEDDFVSMDYSIYDGIDVVYSRFTLHAVKEDEACIVIDKVRKILNKGGYFAIEVRSTKDPLCGVGKNVGKNEWLTDHYRRFVESDYFLKLLLEKDFKLIYFTEENNLSIYKEDNPVLIRIVLEK